MSEAAHVDRPLPMGSIGVGASGWWGAWFLIISETALFCYLFFSYFYYSVQPPANWVPGGPPSFDYAAPQTAIVLIGCVTSWYAERSIGLDRFLPTLASLLLTLALGTGFIALQLLDWSSKPFSFSTSTYSSEYFVITGFHLAHFVVGWVIFLVLPVWTALGYFDSARHVPISVGKVYWYFLAAIWLAVFFVINVTPYLS